MASRRMIASDIFEDEFFCELSHVERLLWIGLIAQCADDQGRMQDRPNSINLKIFTDDGLSTDLICAGIDKFAQAEKITRYSKAGKNMIQIVKWWTYQTPSWAAPSKLPPPDKWIDRVRIHVTGNKVKLENWDKVGGYVDSYPPPLPTNLPTQLSRAIEKGEVKGEVNVNDKGEVEACDDDILSDDEAELDKAFKRITNITSYSLAEAQPALKQLVDSGATVEYMQTAFEEVRGKYPITSPQSLVTPTIIVVNRNRKTLPDEAAQRKKYTEGKYAEFIEH